MLFNKPLREHPPLLQLLLLLMLCLMTGGLFAYLAISTSSWLGDFNVSALLSETPTNPSQVPMIWYLQGLSALGAFVIPGLIFAYYWDFDTPWEPLSLARANNSSAYVITAFLMVASIPLIYAIYALNQQMALPAGWESLEESWKAQEERAAATIGLLLGTPGWLALAINIIILVAIPAFGEELIFRGLLQRIFFQSSNNQHVAIWASAFLFSAIHFQWYGFFPRMLLGAGFGYLVVWSGSLFPAIFGHLLNNGLALFGEHAAQKGWLPGGEDWLMQLPWWITMLSVVATAGLLWIFYRLKPKTLF
jgi:membrane protease YdiL (CAAX protease family)